MGVGMSGSDRTFGPRFASERGWGFLRIRVRRIPINGQPNVIRSQSDVTPAPED